MARLLYDQDCGVCLRSVHWLQRRDRRGRIEPVPTDEPTRRAAMAAAGIRSRRDTVVVEDGKGTWIKSAAFVRCLRAIGGRWHVAATALWLVPRPLRDMGYDWFARNRYRFAKG